MKNFTSNNRILRFGGLITSALILMHCNTAPENVTLKQAPALPSMASMTLPGLPKTAVAKKSAEIVGNGSQLNVAMAYYSNLIWSTVVAANLAGPVLLFDAAHKTEGTMLPDSSGFQWVIFQGEYHALLTAKLKSGNINWSMNLVSGNGMAAFTWFTGTSTLDGRSGDWTFFQYSDKMPQHHLVYDIADSLIDVKAEIVEKGSENFGSYLHWNFGPKIYTLDGYGAKDKGSSLITYNHLNGAGKIEDRKNNNSYCWDTQIANYVDIPCSESKI